MAARCYCLMPADDDRERYIRGKLRSPEMRAYKEADACCRVMHAAHAARHNVTGWRAYTAGEALSRMPPMRNRLAPLRTPAQDEQLLRQQRRRYYATGCLNELTPRQPALPLVLSYRLVYHCPVHSRTYPCHAESSKASLKNYDGYELG